ncbi:unnamed protein product [Peniophora sp. CBMAI 1063]|nr:unnamed protein product [Peniophora sp. CBMAI 1063]
MSNPPASNVPASDPPIQGYTLTDEPSHDPTSVPLPKSPETAAPPTQSFAAPSSPGTGSVAAGPGSNAAYDGPNPFLGPSDGGAGAEPTSPGSRPGETVLSYTPPSHEQDYAPPPGPPPPSTVPPTSAPSFPTPGQPAPNAQPQAHGQSQPQTQTDEAIYASNTQLASLHAIFPDFDAETLQSVLESVGGDQDRAVDTLLGMSDPEHVSTSGPVGEQAHPQQKSQTELDEEFARHLMLQEQEEYNQAQEQAQRAQGERWTPRQRSSQDQSRLSPGAGANAGERDTFAEVQEQVTKFAESGKRTFSSLLTKAKAKLQELDQSRAQGQGQGQSSASASNPPSQTQYQNPGQQQPVAPWASGGSWNQSAPPQPAPGLDRHAQAAAYAPVAPSTVPAPSTTPNTVPGHDFASTGTPPPPRTGSGVVGNANAGVSASPPRALDPSEVGLLPKRPVTLQAAQSGSVGGRGGRAPPEDEGDELEYVENPFEETRR